jgi:hypothetical protein
MNETALIAKLIELAKHRPGALGALERFIDRLLASGGGELTEHELKTAVTEVIRKS